MAFVLASPLAGCAESGLGNIDPNDVYPLDGPGMVYQPPCRVGALKGPTSIGIAKLMHDAKGGGTANTYEFWVSGTADEIVPRMVRGELDIALLPANAAANLYAKTNGKIVAIDVNTLGVLYVVTANPQVKEFVDLAGHTVLMTGKGTTPEAVMKYLLRVHGLAKSVTLEFKSEAAECAAVLASDPQAIAILPQPFATAVCAKVEGLSQVVRLGKVWATTREAGGSQLVTGVTCVNSDYLASMPFAVENFLTEHARSVAAADEDPEGYASYVVEAGIIDNEAIAAAAIPRCGLTCLVGDAMRKALEGYLQVLYDDNPAMVGGALPGDDFYAVVE